MSAPWIRPLLMIFTVFLCQRSEGACPQLFELKGLSGDILSELALYGVRPTAGEGSPESWPADGARNKAFAYADALSQALENSGVPASKLAPHQNLYFEEFLRKRMEAGLRTHVAELFGGGFFVENRKNVDSITALRFGPYNIGERSIHEVTSESQVATQVLGDILNPITWEKFDQSLRERGIPSLDLVTMLPIGGWGHQKLKGARNPWIDIPITNILVLKFIFINILKRLSIDGVFYFQVKLPFTEEEFLNLPELKLLTKDISLISDHQLILGANRTKGSTAHSFFLTGSLTPKQSRPSAGYLLKD